MRRRLVLMMAAMVMLGGVGSPPPVEATTVVRGVSCSTCTYRYKWTPKSVSIARGARVTWRSVNGGHNVVSISPNWSKNASIGVGETTSYTFRRTGTFRYRCTFHSSYNATTRRCSGMCGSVVVG